MSVTVCALFQVSASRSDIEEAEETAEHSQQAEEHTEEGLFDMVTTTNCFIPSDSSLFYSSK